MGITTLSSRDFNQDSSRAKKAAMDGPVFITDRGRPVHVLLSIEQYQQLSEGKKKIADLLAMPNGEEIELETPKLADLAEPAELS